MKAIRDAQYERNGPGAQKECTQLFPLSAIEPYLLSEQVTRLSATSTNDIHNCMLLLLDNSALPAKKTQHSTTYNAEVLVTPSIFFESEGKQQHESTVESNSCVLCQSLHFEEDTRNGFKVCAECGLVQKNIVVSQPSFAIVSHRKICGDRRAELSHWLLNSTMPQE